MDVIKFYSCCLALLLGISVHTYAQEQVLQRKIKVPAKKITIETLGNIISRQAGLVFSFDANKLHGNNTIQLKKDNYTVEELLSLIKTSFNTEYRIYGDHVIFNRQRTPPALVKTIDTKEPVKNKTTVAIHKTSDAGKNKTVIKDTADKDVQHNQPLVKKETKTTVKPANNTAPVVTSTVTSDNTPQQLLLNTPLTSVSMPVNINTTTTSRYIPALMVPWVPSPFTAGRMATVINNKTSAKESAGPDAQSNTPRIRRERRRLFDNPWTLYAAGGLTVDENLFFTPTVKIGIPYLYAIAAYTSNFRIGGFRYGLGAQLPVAEQWNIQLNATTGRLSQTKSVDSSAIAVSVELKGKYHTLALVAERKINERLTVQAGVSYNLIQYAYYHNGKNVPLDSVQFPLSTYAGESIFRYFKPLLEISNDFSKGKPGYNQSWIGFQVGFYYRFR